MNYKKEYSDFLSKIHFVNNDMWWSDEDPLGYEYQKTTNSYFLKPVLPYFKGDSVAIQAGGNCGWVTRELANYFQHVYTFEPDPLSFSCICLNLPQGNVHKFQACLGNEHKLVDMVKDHGKHGTGADYVKISETSKTKIPVILIDDLNLDACDFIQLDLEGYEYFALLGAEKTINKFKPILWIERCWHHRFGITDEMFDDLLYNKWGYSYIGKFGKHDHVYGFQEK